MPKLFEITEEVDDVTEPTVEYGDSWAFDFATGDFVVVGGKVQTVNGYQAWAIGCVKEVLTRRFAHLVYGDDYGCDFTVAKDAGSRDEMESLIRAEIVDALESDERTAAVSQFEFEWSGDSVQVSFVVQPTVGTAEQISLSLTAVT